MRAMPLVETAALDRLSPARLWALLDAETRRAAVRALYASEWDDDASRLEADLAIAATLRFRPIAVRKLPVAKRIDHLCRAVRPGESLSTSLLRALHLVERRAMLAAFLDALGIPQRDGLITDDADPPAPTAAAGRRWPTSASSTPRAAPPSSRPATPRTSSTTPTTRRSRPTATSSGPTSR